MIIHQTFIQQYVHDDRHEFGDDSQIRLRLERNTNDSRFARKKERLTLSLSELFMKTCRVVITFKSVS